MAEENDMKNEDVSVEESAGDFESQAQDNVPGFFGEFLDFLMHNKKWWLMPIIIVLSLLGLLIIATGTGIGPFIYAIF